MKSYLLAIDFDKTVADTGQKGPSGFGLTEAYAWSVEDVLGKEGLYIYENQGGLKNRAPSELVADIFTRASHPEILFAHARTFIASHYEELQGLVPAGKGLPLTWSHHDNIPIVAEAVVRRKLSYIFQEIGYNAKDGSVWPPPCAGFLDFWVAISTLQEIFPLSTAIISSGHELFIRKTFETWRMQQPDILITEDDIRGAPYPTAMERRVKPGQLQLAMAHKEWLHSQGVQDNEFHVDLARESKSRMIYFGDDLTKDGELARRAGIPFGWFHENGAVDEFSFAGFRFGDWRQIALRLVAQSDGFVEGSSFQDILGTHFGEKERLYFKIER